MLKVLRRPHLAMLWSSQLLSAMGDHLFTVAIVWTAVQQVGSAAGLVTAAGACSALLFGLLGGVLADRWNRRMTMIVVDLIRMLCVGVLPFLAWHGGIRLWHLIGVTVVVETLGVLFDPALQASLPNLTSDAKSLQATNALMDATQRLARIFGPGMAGILLLLFSLPHFFTLDAISFGVSALALLALRRHFPHSQSPQPPDASKARNVFGDIQIAFRLLYTHRTLTWALGSLGLVNIAWSAVFIVGVPLLASHQLAGNAGTYGLIVGAYGVGNIISLLVVGNLTVRRRILVMFLGEVLLGAGFLLLASASSLVIALLASALAAFGSPMGDLLLLNMIQTDFPAEHIGKIYSLRQLIGGTGLTLGLLLAAPLFKFVSIPAGIMLCACLIIGVGATGLLRFCNVYETPGKIN